MPPGKIAYWIDWRFINLNKTHWNALHTIFSYIFVIISFFHIVFNWNPIRQYLIKNRKELFSSIALSIIIAAFTILNVSPFKQVMDFREYIHTSWENKKIAPSIPHGELLPLVKLCKMINVDVKIAAERLKSNGIIFSDMEERVVDIAKVNKVKPVKIYYIIKNGK